MPSSTAVLHLIVAGSIAGAGPATAQTQTVTGPKAVYWVTAQTATGMPAPGAGGGGFNPMAMMSANQVRRSLVLRLQGDGVVPSPTAEHRPPAGLGVGDSLPLITPAPGQQSGPRDPGEASEFDARGAGRAANIRVYFGCGDNAASGQPLTYRLTPEEMRRLAALAETVRLTPVQPPAPGAGRTYGAWPTERVRRDIPVNGSLVGEHLVRGDYTPDIRFTLSAAQDFLAPLQLRGLEQPGANGLAWNAVPGARGYFATALGANAAGDVILWSSSDSAVGPMQVPDILVPADLTRLVAQKVVLPASTTECRIPRAVLEAAPEALVRVVAFGDEVNRSWPERPTDHRQPWNIEYTVKVRYSSASSVIAGLDMGAMTDGDESEVEPTGAAASGLPIPGGAIGNAVARGLGGLLGRR